jgi:hypothetical protein
MVIMLFSIFTALYAITPESETASAKLITYPSFLEIVFEEGALDRLNVPIGVEDVITIPFKVGYKIGPAELTKTLAGKLWLFNAMIVFPTTVTVEVIDKPDWAQVYVTPSSLNIDIRDDGEYEWKYVSLVIAPLMDAPAEPDEFIIKASAPARGRIDEISFPMTIPYEPDYNPLIYVGVEDPSRSAAPGETLNFKTTLQNLGNKETIVSIDIKDAPAAWAPLLSVSSVPLGAGETKEVTFSVVTPYDFGWHDEMRSFTVEFTPEIFPKETPAKAGTPEKIQVRVKSMGFFPRGVEFIIIILAIILILVIYIKLIKK